MKYLQLKNIRKQVLFSNYEMCMLFLAFMWNNMKVSKRIRVFAYKKRIEQPRDTSEVRFKNRCVISNRARGIYSKFGLSRLMLRKYLWKGKLTGCRVSSW